ncbi:type I methionyl aminopeptidase [Candidatus Uhrbacteria bacterium]|nr:type I methionyl aminopeptidase [Candidatus Uhrbacteria bacterium]MBD3284194.1 type I methionyl aminopeptidase [Candidatus Uhrbacteria bacterium]
MALIKTSEEIEILKQGGKILSDTLRELRTKCVPGVSTKELDDLAQRRFKEAGGEPSFLNYRISDDDPGFPGAVCTSINEEVVHGIPMPDRFVQEGDIVSLDIGLWYKGLCTDMATTVIVGEVSQEVRDLVTRTRQGLVEGLSVIRAGGVVGDIGKAIQTYLEPFGYGIVRDLVGHGVGHGVHEEPPVPNYHEPRGPRVELKTGMVLAIEPMITLGGWRVEQLDDGWTIATKDGSLCAHSEVTVVVTEKGYELITPWPDA